MRKVKETVKGQHFVIYFPERFPEIYSDVLKTSEEIAGVMMLYEMSRNLQQDMTRCIFQLLPNLESIIDPIPTS